MSQVIRLRSITRQMLQDNPSALFVFGDNLLRVGLGGQAAEMRGEPNAVGIVTKKRPTNYPDAFFSNADIDMYRKAVQPDFTRLFDHKIKGGAIVMPFDGIGTGLAQLDSRALLLWTYLQFKLWQLGAAQRPEGY